MPEPDAATGTDLTATRGGNLFGEEAVLAQDVGQAMPAAMAGGQEEALGGRPAPPGERPERVEESAAGRPASVTVTFCYPGGTDRLLVPSDVALAGLLPELLEIAGVGERGGQWTLICVDGGELPEASTLDGCGVRGGAVLVLEQRTRRPLSGVREPGRKRAESRSPMRSCRARFGRAPGAAKRTGRALSERTARTLPERLTTIARAREALRALVGDEPAVAAGSSPGGPGAFALPARGSALARTREAWGRTDDRRRLERMIVSPRLLRCVTIAVVSPKGGVGKTTTAALLGSLLAFLRRDRVVAVDTNPDWGSLGRRLAPGHAVFIDELLAGPLRKQHPSAIELDAQLGRGPDGLMVAPAPTDPERASRLDENAYSTVFARLAGLVGTLILDCGTGLDSPTSRAALACAGQLVLVTDGEPDTASLVAEAAERRLAPHAPALVLVVNKLDRSSRVDVTALERRIEFADGLVLVPNDRAGADALHGSRFSWNHAPSCWQTPFRELAALLAAGWVRRDLAR